MTGRPAEPGPRGCEIRPCCDAERPDFLALLNSSGLPEAGLSEHWGTAWVAVDLADPSVIAGSVALEVHGAAGLLRSLATRADRRARGVGSALFDFVMAQARHRGLETVALLTTTAEPFFSRRGFEPVSREDVPPSLHASEEFRGACPQSARVMMRQLR